MDVRIIPCLQLIDKQLVKTRQFRDPHYVGDPLNTVRIFNELEVDELCFLDIRATVMEREPHYELLQQISDECFMPLSYGGGIKTFEQAQKLFSCGFEKIILNTVAYNNPQLIKKLSEYYGSQAIVVAIDVKKNWLGTYYTASFSGTKKEKDPVQWAQQVALLGAGEILLTSIDREGTWSGFDFSITNKIVEAVNIPVIAHGGAGHENHIKEIIEKAGVSAVAAGSMFVYQKKDMGVLVNFPKHRIETVCQ
jgi:imidazole glycerol-phosphate synthase subunit HisF